MNDISRSVLAGCSLLSWALLLLARHLASAIMTNRFTNYYEAYHKFYDDLFFPLGVAQWFCFCAAILTIFWPSIRKAAASLFASGPPETEPARHEDSQ